MKRFLTSILLPVLLLCALAVTAAAEDTRTCACCGENVEWTQLTDSHKTASTLSSGHYYADFSGASWDWTMKNIASGQTVCIDLNGKNFAGTTGAFVVLRGGQLNIMDSVGGGRITGRGRSDGIDGAALKVESGGTANLYSGTLSYVTYGSRYARNGGVVCVDGTFGMYGGTVTGGVAKNAGGNIYVAPTGAFYMYGGSVTGGSADALGNCVLGRGTVVLSGDASVDELYLKPRTDQGGPALADLLTIKNKCTGTVVFKMDNPVAGADIGNAENADLSGANYTVQGGMLSVVVKGTNLEVSSSAACVHCGKNVDWTPLTEAYKDADELTSGHYYLAFAGDSCEMACKMVLANENVCLNLNGKTLRGTTRAFVVYDGGVLNIMGQGVLKGRGGSEKTANGGTIQVSKGGTLNLYSGTISFENDPQEVLVATAGGNVYVEGTMNMYGGTLEDGIVTENGANAYVIGTLNMYGGQIRNGTSDYGSGNIYVDAKGVLNAAGGTVSGGKAATVANSVLNRGTVKLSGNANIQEIRIMTNVASGGPALGNCMVIQGAYTGTTELVCAVTEGLDIGNGVSADLSGANISVKGSALALTVVGGDIRTVGSNMTALVMDGETLTTYAALADALAACQGTDKVLALLADVQEDLVISQDLTLDLNGKTVSGTVSGEGTLYCMDSATDDFTVADGVYGKITGTIAGHVAAAEVTDDRDGYVMIDENQTLSFHRIDLSISGMSVKPSSVGVYFNSNFAGDEKIAALVDSFGVALSVVGEPTAENMNVSCQSTRFDKSAFNTDASNTSSLLYGIMKPHNGDIINSNNAETVVYGRAYVKLTDGQLLFGTTRSRDFRTQLEMVDEKLNQLTATQKKGMLQMYEDYQNVMDSWTIPTLVETVETQKRYAAVEKTATQTDIDRLNSLYAGTTAYHGEMHDHAATGGRSDGKQPLSVWKKYMEILDMDFATIVDHKQVRHMYLDEWDDTMFIGGSEAAVAKFKDSDENFKPHYNMIFADPQGLINVFETVTEFNYSGGDPLTAEVKYYPSFTRARFGEVIDIVKENGGFFVLAHPRSDHMDVDAMSFWFRDWVGLEVLYTYGSATRIPDNYKLWTDLLAAGKYLWATAGNDEHNMPSDKGLSTFYSTQKQAQSFLDLMRVGNFTAGRVGIRMSIGDNVMGSQTAESYVGKRLVFSVGDFHTSVLDPTHTYRVDLIADADVVFSQEISCQDTTYFALDAQESKFYRVEVYDTTTNTLIALGNPIWNAE